MYRRFRHAVWHLIVNIVAASGLCPVGLRLRIYRWSGIDHKSHSILSGVYFQSPNVRIGDRTFLNTRASLHSEGGISIGSLCYIGPEVHISTYGHVIGPREQRAGDKTLAPVTIGDGCWIGSRALILAGVKIAEGCVIAAGSVVTQDCEADGLYAGCPAERKRTLGTGQPSSTALRSKTRAN